MIVKLGIETKFRFFCFHAKLKINYFTFLSRNSVYFIFIFLFKKLSKTSKRSKRSLAFRLKWLNVSFREYSFGKYCRVFSDYFRGNVVFHVPDYCLRRYRSMKPTHRWTITNFVTIKDESMTKNKQQNMRIMTDGYSPFSFNFHILSLFNVTAIRWLISKFMRFIEKK